MRKRSLVHDFYQPPNTESDPEDETIVLEFDVSLRASEREALFQALRRRKRGRALLGAVILLAIPFLPMLSGGSAPPPSGWMPFALLAALLTLIRWARWQRAMGSLVPHWPRSRWRFVADGVVVSGGGRRVRVARKRLETLAEIGGGIVLGGASTLLFVPASAYDESMRQAIRAWFRPGRIELSRGRQLLVAHAVYWPRRLLRFALIWLGVILFFLAIWHVLAP